MTLTRLRAKARRALHLDNEKGATDPILVIAAIAVSLILLIGGSFAVAGIISNGKDLNAKSDLDKIATAEAGVSSNGGSYMTYNVDAAGDPDTTPADLDTNSKNLSQQSIGFTPTPGDQIKVVADGTGWIAEVKSTTGTDFWRASGQSTVYTQASSVPTTGDLTAPASL